MPPITSPTCLLSRRCRLALCLVGLLATAPALAGPAPMLIDDFSRDDGVSALGTRWQGFSDRVMGGRSELRAAMVEGESGPVMAMSGRVRLDNNGGFIQMRLPLSPAGPFDARGYRAIALRVRGRPGAYFLHLRSSATRLPWQFYRAPLTVTDHWETVVVPLDGFRPQSLSTALDLASLQSLALVAYGEAFDAHLEVARIELVR